MNNLISVIIPTYNPNPERFNRTLNSLKAQTRDLAKWELIIVDNNSAIEVDADISWHPQSRIVKAPDPGLTYARMKGFEEASGAIIVLVDDDNILDANYLENVSAIFENHPEIGAIGGKSIPDFEVIPPSWIGEFSANLALRDLGNIHLIAEWNNEYPGFAPIGAGMSIRKEALKNYINKIRNTLNVITDRIAGSLSSGGDNDIVIEILKAGWKVGYFPELSLQHIIPAERLTVQYLAKLLHDSNKSWVELLFRHNISPWKPIPKWTLPLRKYKAWITSRAWKNAVNYIKWQGICGMFEGLSILKNPNDQ